MSNTYQLTQEIHNLINQINQKTGKELRVESDTFYYVNRHGEVATEYYYYGSKMGDDDTFTFNPENIQRLLCELDLGQDLNYKITNQMITKDKHDVMANLVYATQLRYLPFSKAKALSDKWFSLQETDGKATPSLWNSGEEGQIQVLTELKEVLEVYLTTNKTI